MKNISFLIGLVILIIVVGGVFAFSRVKPQNSISSSTNYEYFWSKICPHCARVQEFMDGWEGKDKITINKYEVNESRENAGLFLEKGTKLCNISRNQLGVPLLITPEGKCLMGDESIIQFFKELDL